MKDTNVNQTESSSSVKVKIESYIIRKEDFINLLEKLLKCKKPDWGWLSLLFGTGLTILIALLSDTFMDWWIFNKEQIDNFFTTILTIIIIAFVIILFYYIYIIIKIKRKTPESIIDELKRKSLLSIIKHDQITTYSLAYFPNNDDTQTTQ